MRSRATDDIDPRGQNERAQIDLVIQDHVIPSPVRGAVLEHIRKACAHTLAVDEGTIQSSIVTIAPGHWFTAGEPSAASIVRLVIPPKTTERARNDLMSAVCTIWQMDTGCAPEDLVVVAVDPTQG